MRQEQREHVEKMLIDLMEKAHCRVVEQTLCDGTRYMKAATEIAHALIALQESATDLPRTVRTVGMIDEKPLYDGITVEMPKKPHGKTAEIKIMIHADTSELDEAIAKAERLEEILRRMESPERTDSDNGE